nr:MAG TPA: hypothetical protein [Caudoviricetes sp.]
MLKNFFRLLIGCNIFFYHISGVPSSSGRMYIFRHICRNESFCGF